MLLMIDNYDSFTYNLVQYLGELGERVAVYRNDQITLNDVDALAPSHVVISPGPCTPNEAGISVDLVREYGDSIPILGVCLGHQSIAQAYGGDIVRRAHADAWQDLDDRAPGRGYLQRTAQPVSGNPLPFSGGRRIYLARLFCGYCPRR